MTILQGALWLRDTQALPAGVPVSIADTAMLWVESATGDKTFSLDNVLTGTSQAYLVVYRDTLRLTGDSPGFLGSVQPAAGARLRVDGTIAGHVYPRTTVVCGSGTVGRLQLSDASVLSPGGDEYAIGGLKTTGNVELFGDSTLRMDISDPDGEPGMGYDTLQSDGPLGIIVGALPTWKATVALRSSDGIAGSDTAGFDPAVHYRWHLMTATTGSVRNFSADAFSLDATAFANDLAGGSFAVEVSPDGKSLDVVFTPKAPNTHIWSGLSLTSSRWSDPWNWLGLSVPSDGDHLAFVGILRQENVNDCLTSVGDVRLWNAGFSIGGDPLTMSGGLRNDAGLWTSNWNIETTLTADATIKNDCGTLRLSSPVHLNDGTDGHGLTVSGPGTTELWGDVDGTGTSCTLTKEGDGDLALRGTNTFGGAVDISAGLVRMQGTQALPAGVPVAIYDGATLVAGSFGKGGGAGTWDNALSGAGSLAVELDHLRLTGDSHGFTGVTIVEDGTLLVDDDLAAAP